MLKVLVIFSFIPSLTLFSLGINAEENDIYSLSLSQLMDINIIVKSLATASDNKKRSVIAKDSIVAQDVIDFADLNIAESIQRMPGVAITREGNEGRHVSLRGAGPRFTQVQINGMHTLVKSSSPMDSRGAVRSDRSFDFNVFPAEMFNEIDIYKSSFAKLDEGGIGGTIALKTHKPFDMKDNLFAVSVYGGGNTLTSDISPRLTIMASNIWGKWGVLASGFYSSRDVKERGYNTFRWRQRTTTNYSDSLSPEISEALENGDVWFSRGNRYSVWENNQKRTGLSTALQYFESSRRKFGLTLLYSELRYRRNEWHLGTIGSSSTALGRVENLRLEELNGHQEAIYGEFSDISLRTESRQDKVSTKYHQLVYDWGWPINDKFSTGGLIGWSKSDFDQPQSDKVYLQTLTPAEITVDFTDNRFYARNTYSIDTGDVNQWRVREIDLREDIIVDEFFNVKGEFEYAFSNQSQIDFGIHYKQYIHKNAKWTDDNIIRSQPAPQNNDVLDNRSFFFTYRGSRDAAWAAANVERALDFYGVNTKLNRSEFVDKLKERIYSVYSQYNLSLDSLFGVPFKGNVGARWYELSLDSVGRVDNASTVISHSANDILPLVNAVFSITPSVRFRFSGSRQMNRRFLDEGMYAISVNQNAQTVNSTFSNPRLDPYISNNFESSIEWHIGSSEFYEIAFFQKDIKNVAETITTTEPFYFTGLSNKFLGDGQNENTPYEYTRLEEKKGAKIQGIEFSGQKSLTFLPSPLNSLGVIANLTYVEGELDYNNVQGTGQVVRKDFEGLSNLSGNLSIYYERNRWGARLSSAYRDRYINRVESGNSDEDERGFHDTWYVDLAAYYLMSKKLKLSLEVGNITNEKETQYSDSNNRAYNTTNSGTTFYLGFKYVN